MSYRRRAGGGKRDTAEAGIVEALEQVGVRVWRLGGTGNPDLLCHVRGEFFALEVKTDKGTTTRNQQDIPWPIVRTPQDAIAAVMNTRVAARLRPLDYEAAKKAGEASERRVMSDPDALQTIRASITQEEKEVLSRVAPLDAGAAPQGSTASRHEPSPSLPSGPETRCGVLSGYGPQKLYGCIHPAGHTGEHINQMGYRWIAA